MWGKITEGSSMHMKKKKWWAIKEHRQQINGEIKVESDAQSLHSSSVALVSSQPPSALLPFPTFFSPPNIIPTNLPLLSATRMSVRHGNAAAHHPQSLPSFAQAFSSTSLDKLSAHNNALPPIQSQAPLDNGRSQRESPPQDSVSQFVAEHGQSRRNGRKRSHPDSAPGPRDEQGSDSLTRQSPRLIRVKEEQDELIDDPSPPPPHLSRSQSTLGICTKENGALPPSNAAQPISKKRRVTVSAPETNSLHPMDTSNATIMSPIVVGLPAMRDDPAAVDQVRSMLTIKQNQKALIEQRRGSLSGPSSSPVHTHSHVSVNVVNAANAPNPPGGPTPRGGSGIRSPNLGTTRTRNSMPGPDAPPASARQPSPSGLILASQQSAPPHPPPQHLPDISSHPNPPHPAAPGLGNTLPNALPPPPISFARRRAGGAGKKKPADIVISPRDTQSNARLQPVIQSAPPIPQGGGQAGLSGRFPMVLPSLPPVLGAGQSVRRMAPGNVPPTPTRLSMRGSIAAAPSIVVQPASAGERSSGAAGGVISGYSPPASVPIATTLVPPTPASLHRPGYSSDKASFLAPFEVFYDALRDAKELKGWLGEQLQKSNALTQSLQQQQEMLEQTIEATVEKRIGVVREEIFLLRRQVEELRDALQMVRGESMSSVRRRSLAAGDVPMPLPMSAPTGKGWTSSFRVSQQPTASPSHLNVPSDMYTFPSVDPLTRSDAAPRAEASSRGALSPGPRERDRDRDTDIRNGVGAKSNGGSPVPAPFDLSRRQSVSAVRMDPPPPPPHSSHLPDSSPATSARARELSSSSAGNAKGPKTVTQKLARLSDRPGPLQRRPSSQYQQQQKSRGEVDEQSQKSPPGTQSVGASGITLLERKRGSVVESSPKSGPVSPMDES
ncbi:hypothetical protein EW146_g9259 [Bondarzewia mesenterica]|uniref:Uncharacterized protein n=1 Tax=Bondarzewia mesenterica TaxID=1095465 RepID=A0A4S4L9A3_9AGAM|nr:hypothetical protein EW146_g9259 [Bondarzewia mesenterica]